MKVVLMRKDKFKMDEFENAKKIEFIYNPVTGAFTGYTIYKSDNTTQSADASNSVVAIFE